MATIKKGLPHDNFTKVGNSILFDTKISNGAFRLYSVLASYPNGKRLSNEYFFKLGVIPSKSSYLRWKKELVDAGLILLDRLGPREYDLYIGHGQFLAKEVKAHWEKEK